MAVAGEAASEPEGLVVIGYDGSDGARDAVRHAAQTIRHNRALVVYVHPRPEQMAAGMDIPVALPQEAAETRRRQAREIAAKGAALATSSGLAAEGLALEASGSFAETLLRVARERDAAAIVVGTRGLGGVRSALLGSVSSKLIHDADRPVVVIPHSSTAA